MIATLQSISEFTIVNEAPPAPDAVSESGAGAELRAPYESPRATETSFDATVAEGEPAAAYADDPSASTSRAQAGADALTMGSETASSESEAPGFDAGDWAGADITAASDPDSTDAEGEAPDPDVSGNWTAAARLDAVAARLRSGEFELPLVTSEMGTAAVLAAVLAALLKAEG